jgi:hypothetical protein
MAPQNAYITTSFPHPVRLYFRSIPVQYVWLPPRTGQRTTTTIRNAPHRYILRRRWLWCWMDNDDDASSSLDSQINAVHMYSTCCSLSQNNNETTTGLKIDFFFTLFDISAEFQNEGGRTPPPIVLFSLVEQKVNYSTRYCYKVQEVICHIKLTSVMYTHEFSKITLY